MRIRPVVAVAAAVLALGGLAGCGGSTSATSSPSAAASSNGVADLTASEILAQARKATETATSVRISGEVPSDASSLALDLQVTQDGSQGTITVGDQTVKLVITTAMVYMQGDATFYEQFGGAEAAKLLEGKWLAVPRTDPQAASFEEFADLPTMMGSILDTQSTLTKGDTKDVNGTPAIGLVSDGTPTDPSSTQAAGSGGTMWIATVGQPYPLRLEPLEGEGGLDFGEWDAAVTITPPADADVVDISQLQQ